ncbi:MAG: baseplate J/gp47 family protein [Candidatus Levyibacteriota bacterium]
MKISFTSLFGKKEKPHYFLALLLRDEKACGVIFEELKGKIQVKGEAQEYFKTSIEQASENELLEVLDTVISNAEENLPKDVETRKTVFGLKETWVEGPKIKKEYLLKLKKASDSLGLAPIGFLVIHEAIVHLMGDEEGAPVSAILVEVDKEAISISICRAGRIIETKRTKIEDGLAQSCDKLLHYFTKTEILPSRIVLFDGKNTERLQQEFISHAWSKNLSFLHVPQITNLPKGFDAKSVLFGAASQMGFEVLEEKEIDKDKKTTVAETVEEKKEIEEVEKTEPSVVEETKDADEFKKEITEDFASFGFLKDEDIASFKKKENINQDIKPKEEEIEENITEKDEILKTKQNQSIFSFFSFLKILKNIKFPPLPSLPSVKMNKLIFIPPFILFLILALLGFYLFKSEAVIVLNIDPKIIEQSTNMTFSTSQNSDPVKDIIHAQDVSVSQDGEMTADVSGKKEVGDKAKGTVTILSSLSGETTIKEGAIVTSSNDLKFVLDSNVKLASSSGLDDLKSNKANVTANDIGKEYNLPSGTKFTIGSFDNSQLVAKNDNPFSGGTKKEVTAVSKADQDKLLSDLPKKLEENAKNSLLQKMPNDQALLPIFTATDFTKKEFSQKIGDEAQNLKLTATISFTGLAYKKGELDSLLKNYSLENANDMILAENGTKYDLTDLKLEKSKEVSATLNLKLYLLPKFDEQKLTSSITGKSIEESKNILLKLPQVTGVDIQLNPSLPFLPKIMPRFSKNIKLTLNSEE